MDFLSFGRTYADKLVQVDFKDGVSRWVLIHVEVQGEPEAAFAERMFKYNYRIRDKYEKDIVSLAVLSDTTKKFRPSQFEFKLAGCEITFKFPTVKLLDWKDRLDELHTSRNVFALIVAAQLQAKLLKQPGKQLDAKAYLIRLLYQRGYSQAQLLELFRLIDWMIRLPDNLEIEFKQIVDQIEEDQKMAYITSVERIAMQQGMQQGMLQGMERGIEQGMERGKLELAIEMVRDFNLPVKTVAEKYKLSLNELMDKLNSSDSTKH